MKKFWINSHTIVYNTQQKYFVGRLIMHTPQYIIDIRYHSLRKPTEYKKLNCSESRKIHKSWSMTRCKSSYYWSSPQIDKLKIFNQTRYIGTEQRCSRQYIIICYCLLYIYSELLSLQVLFFVGTVLILLSCADQVMNHCLLYLVVGMYFFSFPKFIYVNTRL